MLNLRLARPELLIDVNGVKEMQGISQTDAGLTIGALTRHREVELTDVFRKKLPLLAEAAALVAHPQIRNRGTFGGSLCHADPTGEFPTGVTALEGTLIVQSAAAGPRELKPDEFFLDYLTTSLEPMELLTAVKIPWVPKQTGHAFLEVSDGSGGNAVVCVAVLLTLQGDFDCETPVTLGGWKACISPLVLRGEPTCVRARVAIGGVSPTPIRASKAEALLESQTLTEEVIAAAAAAALEGAEPETDMRWSADYKRSAAQVLVQRATRLATARAKGVA
jgi:CO/xanthine dehydrogenase FAD-binding subunit